MHLKWHCSDRLKGLQKFYVVCEHESSPMGYYVEYFIDVHQEQQRVMRDSLDHSIINWDRF